MRNNKIVFLGGVGSENDFGGELTKNKEIIRRLKEMDCNVTVLDSYKCSSNYSKLILLVFRFLWNLIFNTRASFILSSSFNNVYPFIKIIHYYPVKVHLVYWVIGGNLADRIKEGFYSRKYLNDINLYIVEGEKMKRDMGTIGFKNVIFRPNFKSVGNQLSDVEKSHDCVSFVFLSRIMPEKGCGDIISAIKEIIKQADLKPFRVDFYGQIEPTFAKEFQEACNTIPNINYCGVLDLRNEENYKLLSKYHYMLFPTYWIGEGFPGVIIDAYKSGLPVIATDWNLNTEFIQHNFTGYIINPHSITDLKDEMLRCIEGYSNYSSLVKNCLEEVKKYDTDVVINWNLLMQLLPSRKTTFRNLIKKNKLIYSLYYSLFNKDYKAHKQNQRQYSIKSLKQIKKEKRFVADYWGCKPLHYTRYGLYARNISEDELLDYIPPYIYYNEYLTKRLQETNTDVYEDKLSLYFEFINKGINTPKILGVVKEGQLYDVNWKPIVYEDLLEYSKERLFFKPINGRGGNGIRTYHSDLQIGLMEFLASLDKDLIYILQKAITQRDDFAEINPSSVNTLRVITQNVDGAATVRACVLRCGRNGSSVDNSDQGGLSVAIDVESGHFHASAISEHGASVYEEHPDTHIKFADRVVNEWPKIRSLVEKYASQFPEIKEIGWDVAVTPSGISVIEMNLGFGLDHLQVTCGGMRRILNVYPYERS